jgi:hypothetical protein
MLTFAELEAAARCAEHYPPGWGGSFLAIPGEQGTYSLTGAVTVLARHPDLAACG